MNAVKFHNMSFHGLFLEQASTSMLLCTEKNYLGEVLFRIHIQNLLCGCRLLPSVTQRTEKSDSL